jgi:glycine cleavage system regulatory protein
VGPAFAYVKSATSHNLASRSRTFQADADADPYAALPAWMLQRPLRNLVPSCRARLSCPRGRAAVRGSPALRTFCSVLELDHEPRPQEVVLNVSGPDRVGVVHDIASRIVDIGGNVGVSQAITVKGTFIAAFAISVDIRADLPELCKEVTNALPDFTVSLLEAIIVDESTAHSAHFIVSMADHIGAVHEITGIFAQHELSVVALKTTHERGHGGREIFGMQGTVSSEQPINVDALSKALEVIEESRGVDVQLWINPPGPAPQDLFALRHVTEKD